MQVGGLRHLNNRLSLSLSLEVKHPQTYKINGGQGQHRWLVDLQHLNFQQRYVEDKLSEKSVSVLGVDKIGEDLEEAARTWKL